MYKLTCGINTLRLPLPLHALPIPLPEFRRRHPLLTLEKLPESRLVREAELVGNLLMGHLGGQQGVLDLAD